MDEGIWEVNILIEIDFNKLLLFVTKLKTKTQVTCTSSITVSVFI